MQLYMQYKDYYDWKAKAAPPKEKHYYFILQPKADSQASKDAFRDYRWIGPFGIQKVLSNGNYIVRRVNTNTTQILHRIRFKTIVPIMPLQNKHSGEKLHSDDEIVIPQNDLYTKSWEADFDKELFKTRKDNWPDTAICLPNNAASGRVDNYVTQDECSSAHEDESSSKRNECDVTENEIRPTPATSRDMASSLNEPPSTTENEKDVINELNDEEIASRKGADINVPGILGNEHAEENSSPRGEKNNLRPNPNPNYTDEYRY